MLGTPKGPSAVGGAVSLLVCVTLAAVLHFSHDRITDGDSFYHLRHAWVYATQGLGHAAFPWTEFSVIRTLAADLWYGLHVLMIPLTWLGDRAFALKLGSFVATASALVLFHCAQRRVGAAWPLLGTLVFAGASADLLYRITMLRPHPISLGLVVLLFADLTTDAPTGKRGRLVWLLATSAAVAWLHLAMAWLPLFVAGLVAAVRVVRRDRVDASGAAAVLAGAVLGWVLRPNPWGAIELAWIQVAHLTATQQSGVPLSFGHELRPLALAELYRQLAGLVALVAVALVALVRLRRRGVELGTAVWASLAAWPIFGALTFVFFRRAGEILVAFAVTFVGLVAARARSAAHEGSAGAPVSRLRTVAALVVVTALVIMPITTLERFVGYMRFAYDPERYRAVGEWLEAHAAPGEVVVNPDWDRFGFLFFWNARNHYVYGMDPIFLYAYDPALYWKLHYLAMDQATSHTYGSAPGTRAFPEETHTVLRRDFRASYIVLEHRRAPALIAYLAHAPGFVKVFETDLEVLFRVVDPTPGLAQER